MLRQILSFFLVAIFATPAFSWSECGYHIIAVMAFRKLPAEQQAQIIGILKAHPRFDQDFRFPGNVRNENEYLIGKAGYWPDVARGTKYDRPTWHYQLECIEVFGGRKIDVPQSPGPLPPNANLDDQNLYIVQATQLCSRILQDPTESNERKALAICWMCHLVADAHQPCHTGSIYSASLFPNGDRCANSIAVKQGSNLHAFWDGLLGTRYDAGDVERRIKEIEASRHAAKLLADEERINIFPPTIEPRDPAIFVYQADQPQRWLSEGQGAAMNFVYAREVRGLVGIAERTGAELAPIALGDVYVQEAGDYAQLAALKAAERLGYQLKNLKLRSID